MDDLLYLFGSTFVVTIALGLGLVVVLLALLVVIRLGQRWFGSTDEEEEPPDPDSPIPTIINWRDTP